MSASVDNFLSKRNLDKLKPNAPIVTFLLDESSPMAPQRASTITAFAGYLTTLQKNPLLAFSLYRFNTALQTVCELAPIASVAPLEDYRPRGGMHLIKNGLAMIHRTEQLLKGRPNPVVVTIQRDAEDTSGQPWQMLRSAIERTQGDYGWQYQLLGCACTDPYPMAQRMGISQEHTISYDAPTANVAFQRTAEMSLDFLSGKRPSVAYERAHRVEVADRFTPAQMRLGHDSVAAPTMEQVLNPRVKV